MVRVRPSIVVIVLLLVIVCLIAYQIARRGREAVPLENGKFIFPVYNNAFENPKGEELVAAPLFQHGQYVVGAPLTPRGSSSDTARDNAPSPALSNTACAKDEDARLADALLWPDKIISSPAPSAPVLSTPDLTAINDEGTTATPSSPALPIGRRERTLYDANVSQKNRKFVTFENDEMKNIIIETVKSPKTILPQPHQHNEHQQSILNSMDRPSLREKAIKFAKQII